VGKLSRHERSAAARDSVYSEAARPRLTPSCCRLCIFTGSWKSGGREARYLWIWRPCCPTMRTPIQGTQNSDPDLPPVPGRHPAVGRYNESIRHGTVSLLAGIEPLSGEVPGLVRAASQRGAHRIPEIRPPSLSGGRTNPTGARQSFRAHLERDAGSPRDGSQWLPTHLDPKSTELGST
jgi:hypothetical protein